MQEPSRPSDHGPIDVPIGAIVDRLQYSGSVDSLRELIQELSAGWDDLSEREKRRHGARAERAEGSAVAVGEEDGRHRKGIMGRRPRDR